MTREEAIYWIENLSGSWDGQYREALDMAISALMEQEEYEIQRHLKHFDIKEPRPEAVTKCHDLYDEDGDEILEQDSLEKKTSDSKTSDKKTSEWINVNDRLPNDTEKVLVYTTTGNTTVARWSQRQEKFVASGHITVTHWMSLPEKPEEGV